MESNTSFTESLLAANKDIWDAMTAHPWVRSFADGTLPDAAFIAWAQQCRLYCIMERRALLIMRALNPSPELDQLLAKLEDDTVREPRELAETLRSINAPVAEEAWPICLGYGLFIISSARDGLPEGLAALYACEKAYLDTWTALLPSTPVGSRWYDWVYNWTQDVFRETVTAIGRHLDDLAGTPSNQMRERMEHAFRGVAQYELAFWEMCWKQQGWPGLSLKEE